ASAPVAAWASPPSSRSCRPEPLPFWHQERTPWRAVLVPKRSGGRRHQQVAEAVVVPGGSAEEVLVAVGAADVEVKVVFPREADAAVDLDAVLGAELGRLAR